tara:strand:- start:162 stop:446 length:285 start_codon:yes stop_codon:yes gene_type:complete
MNRSRSRKIKAARQLAYYFRSKGKIARTIGDYSLMPGHPILPSTVNQLFRGWPVMLQFLTMVDPTLEADLAPKPKAAPKPKPKPKVKANDTKNV